jgi:hypothetical protein
VRDNSSRSSLGGWEDLRYRASSIASWSFVNRLRVLLCTRQFSDAVSEEPILVVEEARDRFEGMRGMTEEEVVLCWLKTKK